MTTFKVKDIMDTNPKTVHENESIAKAIHLLTSIPESALPVVDENGKVVGELSQEDLLLKVIGKQEVSLEDFDFENIKLLLAAKDSTINDFINRHELTARPDDHALDIVKLMYETEISTVPVVDKENNLLGILSDICVLKHYKKLSHEE